jgi:hypothetical protein
MRLKRDAFYFPMAYLNFYFPFLQVVRLSTAISTDRACHVKILTIWVNLETEEIRVERTKSMRARNVTNSLVPEPIRRSLGAKADRRTDSKTRNTPSLRLLGNCDA